MSESLWGKWASTDQAAAESLLKEKHSLGKILNFLSEMSTMTHVKSVNLPRKCAWMCKYTKRLETLLIFKRFAQLYMIRTVKWVKNEFFIVVIFKLVLQSCFWWQNRFFWSFLCFTDYQITFMLLNSLDSFLCLLCNFWLDQKERDTRNVSGAHWLTKWVSGWNVHVWVK